MADPAPQPAPSLRQRTLATYRRMLPLAESLYALLLLAGGAQMLVYAPFAHDPRFAPSAASAEVLFASMMLVVGVLQALSLILAWHRGRFIALGGNVFLWFGFLRGYLDAAPHSMEVALFGVLTVMAFILLATAGFIDE